MPRLDDYISTLLAVDRDLSASELCRQIDIRGEGFVTFVIDHGLGPLWHERTGRKEFKSSRITSEALFIVQHKALQQIDERLNDYGIEYALFKGAANRLLIYNEPSIRACYDLDMLVRPTDRVQAAGALSDLGFVPEPDRQTISHQLVLSRGDVDIDLHWGLLRGGRLRRDEVPGMIERRTRAHDLWMLNANDTTFLLLVHPAFAKHLAGYGMGMHRVADLISWLKSQRYDWQDVEIQLRRNGVTAAAWATMRWASMLTPGRVDGHATAMIGELEPGVLRRTWLNQWLERDWPQRTARMHWLRLAAFSPFLHDSIGDSLRAVSGRFRARRRIEDDIAAFGAIEPQPG